MITNNKERQLEPDFFDEDQKVDTKININGVELWVTGTWREFDVCEADSGNSIIEILSDSMIECIQKHCLD